MSLTYRRFKRYREAQKKVKVGSIFLTRYEKARIIGARALQISFGASPFVDVPPGMTDPMRISSYELSLNMIPITIMRKLPGGRSQNIPIQWLVQEEM